MTSTEISTKIKLCSICKCDISHRVRTNKLCKPCSSRAKFLEFNRNITSEALDRHDEMISRRPAKLTKEQNRLRTNAKQRGVRKTMKNLRAQAHLRRYDLDVCQVCKKDSSEIDICVDHDHVTGKMRAILCKKCNLAFAGFGDQYETVTERVKELGVCLAENKVKNDQDDAFRKWIQSVNDLDLDNEEDTKEP